MEMDVKAILLHRDRQSFDWLYSRYAGMLFGVIRKMVAESSAAENLLLETFVAAWASLDQFEGTGTDLFGWLLRIARRKVNEHIKESNQGRQPAAEHRKELRASGLYSQLAGVGQYSNL